MRSDGRVVFMAASLSLLSIGPVLAQSNQEINAVVPFSFAPPGARSLALGGAFLGLADDATAAYANPAGLTVLTKPEVSLELRSSRFTSAFTDRGSMPPRNPSGIGVDTISGLVDGSVDDTVTAPSFVSLVYPKGKVAFALFRHELVNYKATIETNGAYIASDGQNYRYFPAKGNLELKAVDYGLGIGVQLNKQLSVGLGLSLFDLSLVSRTDRYNFDSNTRPDPGFFYGPPDYRSSNVLSYQTQDGSGTALAASAGLLWKPSAKVQIGAVYRKGPDFADKVAVANHPGPKGDFIPVSQTSGFKVPDTFGAGGAVKPSDRLTVTLDVLRVLHSQRLDHFINAFSDKESVDGQFEVKDGTELHFGAEYVFSGMKRPLAIRAGGWFEPESCIHFMGDPNTDIGVNNAGIFREGQAYWHGTFGLGWVLGSSFQIDFATDLSSRAKIVTGSAVYRF